MHKYQMTLAAITVATVLASTATFADTVFSTADFEAVENGTYAIDNTNFQSVNFQLTQQTLITGIGGHFSQYSSGDNIFGAIVAASSLASAPTVDSSSLEALALAHTVFTPDGSDQVAALSINLAPGAYTLVFGSGLWGTIGTSGLADSQDIIGAPNLFQTVNGGVTWSALNANVRMDVQGTAVPVPASLPLLASALAGLGAIARKRRKV